MGDITKLDEIWQEEIMNLYNAKRMEGKVGLVWSERELVKSDTY